MLSATTGIWSVTGKKRCTIFLNTLSPRARFLSPRPHMPTAAHVPGLDLTLSVVPWNRNPRLVFALPTAYP